MIVSRVEEGISYLLEMKEAISALILWSVSTDVTNAISLIQVMLLEDRSSDERPLEDRQLDDRLLDDRPLDDRPPEDRPLDELPLDTLELTWVGSRWSKEWCRCPHVRHEHPRHWVIECPLPRQFVHSDALFASSRRFVVNFALKTLQYFMSWAPRHAGNTNVLRVVVNVCPRGSFLR